MNILNTTSEDAKPWYRYRGPWVLMLGPFIAVVACIITIYLAVVSNDGLVDDDYYKQGLAINQVTERNEQAQQLGFEADIMQSADRGLVRVLLQANPNVSLPASLTLRITHPTKAGSDQTLVLQGSGGQYSGTLQSPLRGRWHIALEDAKAEWRLAGDWVVGKQDSLHLPSRGEKPMASH